MATVGADFPIVGVGASAGGVEAFSQMLAGLPAATGMAFVLVQHLDPTHSSLLTSSLAHRTQMSVEEATSGARVEPNRIYVIPPNANLAILRGRLELLPRPESRRPHLAIDFFFRALASEKEGRAIGVLLSGTGSDGTEGLRAIKSVGGITFAQAPETAKFGGMPEHAVKAGIVDFCLPVDRIVDELVRLSRHPYIALRREGPLSAPAGAGRDLLQSVVAIIRTATGIDFTDYKTTTIERRIARRMALRKSATLSEYIETLRSDPAEAKALCEDFLIHVTSFLRDLAAYETLKSRVLPEILREKKDGSPVRVWVPGCSTGEEVYSIAFCLLEAMHTAAVRVPVQIFGSDVSAAAIARARAGTYGEGVARDVGPERLARFFSPIEGGYRINKEVRDLCVFVKHDVTRDPPFARLDLISCRNVLIYFGPALQKKVVSLFHYCLNPRGFLILGRSENIGGFAELFSTLDKPNKIFVKTGSSRAIRLPLFQERPLESLAKTATPGLGAPSLPGAQALADRMVLSHYGPPGVLVNEQMEIVQFRGHTSPYLELAPGQASLHVLKMAREGLLPELRPALRKAIQESTAVRRDGVRIWEDGRPKTVNLEILPVSGGDAKERFFLILFEEAPQAPPREPQRTRGKPARAAKDESVRLRAEMEATKEYLQSLIDERQRINDDLAAANEELISGNEELQSTNEELETAKEELQSANEELTTLNDELQSRSQEITQANSDLANLLNAVELPIVILGADRRIRRFTPTARTLMNLIPSDVGRPIDDIRPNVVLPDLEATITEVLASVTLKEREVQDRAGHWFRMQLRPYKGPDDRIDGVILSLVDINVLRRALTSVEAARDLIAGVVDTIGVPLAVLDDQLRILSANPAFYATYDATRGEMEGMTFFDAADGAWNVAGVRDGLNAILEKDTELHVEVKVEIPRAVKRIVLLDGRAIRWKSPRPLILLTASDVTEQRRLEGERSTLFNAAQAARAEAERADQAKDLFLAMLSHELRTPLSSILLHSQILQRRDPSNLPARSIERAALSQAQLIDDLLDVSRIVAGKLEMEKLPVALQAVVEAALETTRAPAEAKGIQVERRIDEGVGPVLGDPTRLQQVVWNLVNNAIKFTPKGGHVTVALERTGEAAQIQVSDTGKGIARKSLPHLFERFWQADSSAIRRYGGLGLGLALVHDLVKLHDGAVRADSAGEGKGATFTVTLPLLSTGRPAAESRGGQRSEATTRPTEHDLTGLRILLVEDEMHMREATAEALEALGAKVQAAASAAEAMEIVQAFRPDVLLCDISMPEEDGYSLLRRIRALGPEHGGDVPAIALTAYAADWNREKSLAAGFEMHVAKPVSMEALREAVRLARREVDSDLRPEA